ncbi:hypothetical protein Vadar_031048 [Vaccinium darrowii]|uniref:Uncharacterized protein n=1 Tax=Vaccinium darrowii TaxID=229202 RepID=A0ACB7Y3K2_9ERIC|nr:hypothetical protein Vadar_031048 [Vaccinium darrowii]
MPTDIPSFLEIQYMFSQIFTKLFFRKIQIFIDHYFCLCRGAALTTGLTFAQRFVGYAVVNVLITYFTDSYNLLDAVGLSLSARLLPTSLSANEATTTEIPHASPEENISVDEATTTKISSASPEENILIDEATTMETSRASPAPAETTSMDDATTAEISYASPEENIPVDEATTTEISPASPEENINNGLVFFAISLVKQWKPLSVMIPMWTTFLVFGLVLSAGDTFFTDQGNNMDPTVSIYVLLMIRKIIRSTPSTFRFITSFTAFPSKISSIISTLQSKFIPKLKTQGIKVTIWTAMVLSIFCCSVAWRVEVHRLHAIPKFEMCVIKDEDVVIPMSIMSLAPQFCLLGLMEGIGRQGLDLFFEVQVYDVQLEKYGSALNEAVIGFGSFLNGLLVFLFRSWFRDTLNCSHLDKYYHMLTVVSFVNMCYYWWVSTFYSNKMGTKDGVEVEETRELIIGVVSV